MGWLQTLSSPSPDAFRVHPIFPSLAPATQVTSRQDSYPSQIFFTLLLSWSPWKKMIKTHLLTRSPVLGSSRGVSISACLKNTLPRQARHKRRSKEGTRSREITPVTNLVNNEKNWPLYYKCWLGIIIILKYKHGALPSKGELPCEQLHITRIPS